MMFDLGRERWIPVLHVEYGSMLVSLREVFKWAGDLTLCHVDPLVTASLRRILLAVVEDALDPTLEMRRAWLEKGLPYRKLYTYLAKHPFDLLDSARPFYQVADLVCSKRSSHTILNPSGNRDNNRLVGNLVMTCDPPPISLAEAAVSLITAQTFSPVGGNSSHGHSSASPLANMPLTYGTGPNLLYELAANAGPRTLPPIWRSGLHSVEAVKTARVGDSPLHSYTSFPRMLRLHPEGDTVRFVSVAAGLRRDAEGDPMVAQVQGGGVQHECSGFSLVAAANLLCKPSGMGRPLVLDHIAELGVTPESLTTLRFHVKQGVALGVDEYEFEGGLIREEAATLTHVASAKQWGLEQILDYKGVKEKENRTKASSKRVTNAVDTFRSNSEALVRQHFAERKTVETLRKQLNEVSSAVQTILKPPLHQALPRRKPKHGGSREKPAKFVERLETLYPSDRTPLKQKGSLETARRVSTFLPRGASVWTQECYVLVARLYAYNPQHDVAKGDLGSVVGSGSLAQSDAAFAKSLQAQAFGELSDAISSALRDIEEPVNWSLLLTDLLDWRTPSKGVAARWQTSFERARQDDQKNV